MKNGALWLDTDGRGIQAHGGSILQHNGIFYWYGENKDTDTHNRSVDFVGFSCYKSRDLLHWENCGLVLSAVNEAGHDLHPDSVCERPSVLYNAETQKFVLWFHLDNRRYTRAEVGLAVSDTPTGPFAYMGSQRPGSHDSRDFTAFQDRDGRAYLFCSSDWNATMRVWELDKTYTKRDRQRQGNFDRSGARGSGAVAQRREVSPVFIGLHRVEPQHDAVRREQRDFRQLAAH